MEDDSFQKDGETIRYQRAGLTPTGRCRGIDLEGQVVLPDDPPDEPKARRKRKAANAAEIAEADADPELVDALRTWRLEAARKKRWPAYTVLSNRALIAVAAAKPRSGEGLLAIPGIGPKTVKRYGGALLRIVAAAEESATRDPEQAVTTTGENVQVTQSRADEPAARGLPDRSGGVSDS